MPLSDGYQTEKDIKRETLELSKAITEFFDDMGVQDRRGFILYICDIPTGVVQFMSDMDRTTSTQVVSMWVKENGSGDSNAPNSEGGQPILGPDNNNS